jgi:hypothetical protein
MSGATPRQDVALARGLLVPAPGVRLCGREFQSNWSKWDSAAANLARWRGAVGSILAVSHFRLLGSSGYGKTAMLPNVTRPDGFSSATLLVGTLDRAVFAPQILGETPNLPPCHPACEATVIWDPDGLIGCSDAPPDKQT